MKKLFSLVLALALVMSMGVTAFAAEDENKTGVGAGDYNAEVSGTYVAGVKDTVFSVDLAWSGLSFTYNAGSKTWNPTKHDYDVVEATGWAESDGKITVTNHSNIPIFVEPTWNAADGYEAAVMTFYNGESEVDKLTIASAEPTEGKEVGSAQIGTIAVKPSGSLPKNTGENQKIGQITVSISQPSSYDESTNTTTVYSVDDLKTAVSAGGTVVLGCDLTCDSQLEIASGTNVTLDLNGHTLTMTNRTYPLWINSGANVTIKSAAGGEFAVTNAAYSIYNAGTLKIESGTIIIHLNTNDGTMVITGGTFGFDPTQYVDTNNYDVNKDESAGTWTVTAKPE